MTNKYQEAFDLKNAIEQVEKWMGPNPTWRGWKIIHEALQAGAEGRILPKLLQTSSFGLHNIENDKLFKVNLFDHTEIKHSCGMVSGEGKTPAEAMQAAIDKIGGGE